MTDGITSKKKKIMKLANASCIANRAEIWKLINEIGQKEIEKDKDFSRRLIEITLKQLGQICRGERYD